MGKKENALSDKSLMFAVRVVKFYQYLCEEKKEFVISKQLLRSGTSIGANIHEGIYAQSKADFINKLQVAQKEAGETEYWLYLLYHSDYMTESVYQSMKADCDELMRLLAATIKSAKSNT